MARKIIDAVLAAVLLLFGLLQINDPPPGNIPWVLIYVAGAVVCGLAAFGRRIRWAALTVAGLALAYAAYLEISVLLSDGSPFTLFIDRMDDGGEEQREAAGLLILAAATAWVGFRRESTAETPTNSE